MEPITHQSKRFSFHKVLAAIGLVLIIAIVVFSLGYGYVLNQESDADKAENTGPVDKVATTSAKTATSSAKDHTADWGTYSNSMYKFSFKYDKQKYGTINPGIFPGPGQVLSLTLGEGGDFNFTVDTKDKQTVMDTLKAGMKPECSAFYELKHPVINGETADEIICMNISTKVKFSNWFFSKFGYTYWMNGDEQIVSTFKFL